MRIIAQVYNGQARQSQPKQDATNELVMTVTTTTKFPTATSVKATSQPWLEPPATLLLLLCTSTRTGLK